MLVPFCPLQKDDCRVPDGALASTCNLHVPKDTYARMKLAKHGGLLPVVFVFASASTSLMSRGRER